LDERSPESSFSNAKRKSKGAGFLARQRDSGFGVGLYRNVEAGKLAGVCAGVAEYIEVDRGMLRLIVMASMLLSGGMAPILYFGGWLILAPAPAALVEGDPLENL